jgi:hypothetical protein
VVVGVGFVGSWPLSRSSVWCAFLWRSASPCFFAVLPCFLGGFGPRELRGCVCGLLAGCGPLAFAAAVSVWCLPFRVCFCLWVFLVRGAFVLFLLGFVFASATGPRRSQEAAGTLEVLAVLSWRVRAAGEERGAAAGKEGQARNHRKRNQLARQPSSGQQELRFRPLPGEEKEAACVGCLAPDRGQVIGKRHSATAVCVCVCARSGGWQQAVAGGTRRAARPLQEGNLDSLSEVRSLGQAPLGF